MLDCENGLAVVILTNTVARALLDLKTVGQGLSFTEVDEVGLVAAAR
jgi:hypothetical protein